ncbi:MAG: T9SS type A sorting domain-containing protein [Melioribacteraceae bacterium]|nr:T9SS type A sorting domain-containing protein [Melioribacteraceae bacterium]MCF8353061.1 T9SS type A sorting domain-containing protein [Melioribacteraceae bacterium]MCF8392793.1 T9SS type A sorting domain-containing protein [Melioribacteraceae bacterium]MCF8418324.1 T9SS type A sorting domain-containing protein [Melioribacteraceae bacterium]
MKKIFTSLMFMLFFIGTIIAQEHTVNYQVIVIDPCNGTSTTVEGGSFMTGESFVVPAATLPSSMSNWQSLYDAIEGSTFGIESGALNENITIGVNVLDFNCAIPDEYWDPDLFMFLGVTVIGDTSGFTGFDQYYFFNEGNGAFLDIPIDDDLDEVLDGIGLLLEDIGFAYYIGGVWDSDGIDFSLDFTNNVIHVELSHFSKFGGGRGTTVGVEERKVEDLIPEVFKLSQNYPNPFNPSTVIRYSLPESGFVTLKVYNSLGQEVKSLVADQKEAGTYEILFNAEGLGAGAYFYELRTGTSVETRKMLLIK